VQKKVHEKLQKQKKAGRFFTLPFFASIRSSSGLREGVGDFNGDSKPDILWRNTSTGANAIWYMNGVNLIGITDLPALPNPDYAIVGR
jgi:hypothetical protein